MQKSEQFQAVLIGRLAAVEEGMEQAIDTLREHTPAPKPGPPPDRVGSRLAIVQRTLGHSSIATPGDDDLRQAMERATL